MNKYPEPPKPPPIRIINNDYKISGWFSKILCYILGHKWISLTCDITKELTCSRCLYEKPKIVWPKK